MSKYETRTARLSDAEKNEMLAVARSPELRDELRAIAKHGPISFDDYVALRRRSPSWRTTRAAPSARCAGSGFRL